MKLILAALYLGLGPAFFFIARQIGFRMENNYLQVKKKFWEPPSHR